MKIGIVGGGISGLSAAYELTKKGHNVVVFERSNTVGGLGTYVQIHKNYIERYYHHFFETDYEIVRLAKELAIDDKLKFYKAKTGIFLNNSIYPFSTPSDLLNFKPFSFLNRIRCGIVVGFLKFLPTPPTSFDGISAKEWIMKYAGKEVYSKIWGPLLEGKFSDYADTIPMMWLWGRIRDRSPKLGYFDGSVKILFDKMVDFIKKTGGKIKLNAEVVSISSFGHKVIIQEKGKKHIFDRVIIATVSPIAEKLIQDKVSDSYRKKLSLIDHLGAVCLILELKHPVQSQYWLNICDKNASVLVVIEHTNMIDKSHYGGRTVMYFANYIHRSNPRFQITDEEVVEEYSKILKKLNKNFDRSWILKSYVSRVPRAQTIFTLHALSHKPSIATPVKNVYMVNIDQMYPHDRNLNQGVELGKKVAEMV